MAVDATDPPVVHAIPIDAIDADALERDRTQLDDEALGELHMAVYLNGIRSPIEVFVRTPDPDAPPDTPPRFGLIAGYRRLSVARKLYDHGDERFATVPAFIRAVADRSEAYRLMVEENAIRADVSPWERATLVDRVVVEGLFETVEGAIEGLFQSVHRNKRRNLRLIIDVIEELSDQLVEPERLSERQLLRLAEAVRAGFGEAMALALHASRKEGPEGQWAAIQPYLDEQAAESKQPARHPRRPGRPRRVVWLRNALAVRRERTREGYVLRFSGEDATSPLLDAVLDEIERRFGPA